MGDLVCVRNPYLNFKDILEISWCCGWCNHQMTWYKRLTRGRRKRKHFLSLLFLAPFPIVLSFDLGSAFARTAGSRKLQYPRHSTIPFTKLIIASALPLPPPTSELPQSFFQSEASPLGIPIKIATMEKLKALLSFPSPSCPACFLFSSPASLRDKEASAEEIEARPSTQSFIRKWA